MGILEPAAMTDVSFIKMTKLDPKTPQGQEINKGLGKLLKERFQYLLHMINDLHKEEKLITTYKQPIGNFPVLNAIKNPEINGSSLQISKGGKSITLAIKTGLKEEDLDIEVIDHNYDSGYSPQIILESITSSLVQLDKLEEDGTVKFERVSNLDQI